MLLSLRLLALHLSGKLCKDLRTVRLEMHWMTFIFNINEKVKNSLSLNNLAIQIILILRAYTIKIKPKFNGSE